MSQLPWPRSFEGRWRPFSLCWVLLATSPILGCQAGGQAPNLAVISFRLGPLLAARPPDSKLPVSVPVAIAASPISAAPVTADSSASLALPLPSFDPNGPLWLRPDQLSLGAPVGDAIQVPSNFSGQITYVALGRIPESITLSATATAPLTLHPSLAAPAARLAGVATLAGKIGPAAAGVIVQFLSPGRQDFAGAATLADGTYSFQVPVADHDHGIVFAREPSNLPALALAEVDLARGGATQAPDLTLQAPGPAGNPLPAPPSGMAITDAALHVGEPGDERDAIYPLVPFHLLGAAPLPTYQLPGPFSLLTIYLAQAQAGTSGSVVGGSPNHLPNFLPPPDLSRLQPFVKAGTTLSWPAVPGASLYILKLFSPPAVVPLWEAAGQQPSFVVPPIPLLARPLLLRVEAWDAAALDVYSVASLRRLQMVLPSGIPALQGRFGWSERSLPAP